VGSHIFTGVTVLVLKKYDVLSTGLYTCAIQSDDKWPLHVNHSRDLMFVFNWVSLTVANKIHCQSETLIRVHEIPVIKA